MTLVKNYLSGLKWDRLPTTKDPRVPFFLILCLYVATGITVLGFNRPPLQVLLIVGTTCLFDMLFSLAFKGNFCFH